VAVDWHVLYYETPEGKCPVREFIDSRKGRNQAKIFALISTLQDRGPTLPRPYADLLEDGIHELRIRLSGDQFRVLYFFCFRRFIVLTHDFVKVTAKVPNAEIQKAKKYRSDFLSRFKESDLEEKYDDI
jgi:phage-related protein